VKAIRFPFEIDKSGKIVSTTDSIKIYQDRVLTLLSTVVYQRPMMPQYGVDIARSLYETMDNMYASVGEAITRAMSYSLPYIKIKDVLIDLTSSIETGTNITVLIDLPNGSSSDVNVLSSTFLPSGEKYGRTL
jgi:phage baseplate assembly protein W